LVDLIILFCTNASPPKILFENCFIGDTGEDCLILVDGVDFKMPHYGPTFSSHKFTKKSGLQYEIGICIKTGSLVWINGPFACGKWNDIQIFRSSLLSHLEDGERVEADDGYVGEAHYVKCPKNFTNPKENEKMQSYVHHHHETVNKRFKDWGIMKEAFQNREMVYLHGDVLRSVAVITQVAINEGEALFSVEYGDGIDDEDL
jgi:hypothetical protein